MGSFLAAAAFAKATNSATELTGTDGCTTSIIAGRGDDRNRPEVLVRIEGQLLVEARIDGQRRAEHQSQRVSVGRSSGDDFGPDVAARARSILDHEWLLEADRQLVGDVPARRCRSARRPQSER